MTINKPKISVLMAVYNGEKVLNYTIDSILDQTFKDFEFLIIDDCSTDRTVDIIKAYNDNRIRLYSNELNLGQTRSLNAGLKLADGEYIARMDADDYSMPKRLERQYIYMTKHPELSVLGTDCLVVDGSDRKRSVSKGCSKYEDIIIKLLSGSPINHVSVVMNKEDILRVGGYDSKYKICADFDLWSRLIRKGYKITTLNEILSAYRFPEDSYSKRNNAIAMKEMRDIISENIRHFSDYEVNKESVTELTRMFYNELVNMSDDSILKYEAIYRNVIMRIKPEFGIKIERSRIKKILLSNYWKAAYHYILVKEKKEARRVITRCVNNHGLNLYSVVIYLLTYLSGEKVSKINYLRAKYI